MKQKVAIIEPDAQRRGEIEALVKSRPYARIALSVGNFSEFVVRVCMDDVPGMIIVDYNAQTKDQLLKLRRLFPRARLLAYAASSEKLLVERAIQVGIDGYVLRNGSLSNLKWAMKNLASGEAWFDPKATRLLLEKVQERDIDRKEEKKSDLRWLRNKYELNSKEFQVLQGLLAAEKYVEIADKIGKSVNTVRYYVKGLYRKMGINSRSELYLLSMQRESSASR